MPKWNDPKSPPDADMTVLMRLDDEEYPVWIGYFTGEQWRGIAYDLPVGALVTGWMELEDAAAVLDAAR